MTVARASLRSNVFSIELKSSRDAGCGNGSADAASGRITIDGFTEAFTVPLGFWGEADYRSSWKRAFEVLSADRSSASCLVTSLTDPRRSNFLVCWPVYREGETVYVQNSIVFLGDAEAFDPAAPWSSVEPRRKTDEDGEKISEWVTSMDSLRGFFA